MIEFLTEFEKKKQNKRVSSLFHKFVQGERKFIAGTLLTIELLYT